jgi:hypothetical protein
MSYSFDGTVHVCAHEVSFWFKGDKPITDELKERLTEEAEERSKSQIIEGYVQGELNYEDEECSYTGWWTTLKE